MVSTAPSRRAAAGTGFPLAARLRSPHLPLALGAFTAVATEPAVQFGRDHATAGGHALIAFGLFARAGVAALALLLAWRTQERLKLVPLLVLAFAFQVAWICMHLALGTKPDQDLSFYRSEGHTLLQGDYPRSEYPTGAVLLFAFEDWLGGGANHVPHAFLMVPCQLAVVAAVWSLRTRSSAWLAALVSVWPMDAFHWEFRFDLLPTALLAAGVALAVRRRWQGAGVLLGLGTAVKWTPALCLVALVVWLVSRGQTRSAVRAVLGFGGAWALLTVPLLVWRPSEVAAAYARQGHRGITGESVWYLPLRAFGEARLRQALAWDAHAPDWASRGVVALQVLVLVGLLVAVWSFRSLQCAAALAALAPAAFLLTNRIFSSQFLVTILAAWALAAALVVSGRRAQLAVGAVAAAATCANALVHPYTLPRIWELASVALFGLALALTTWLLLASSRLDRTLAA